MALDWSRYLHKRPVGMPYEFYTEKRRAIKHFLKIHLQGRFVPWEPRKTPRKRR